MDTYHPKRTANEILSEAEKEELLRQGNHVSIALCDNNTPYVVSLSYGYDREGNCLYFHCANHGDKLDFIRKNPKACATLLKDNGYLHGQCSHDYESLIMRGTMHIVSDLAEKKHAFKILLHHLEKDPQPIFDRNIKSDATYNGIIVLRLDMDSVIGKKYIG
jgi:nitroimidazol reductase NimA-like FMN-containing flavoprotein (pyridoxamine 5'-phosphate oxidase superfamily)